ncbi:MAG: hypothetical protein J6332_02065 [Abditibacteriota bacterium]|nr:hypothetical protein [Abditibacteriota bacterium]
MKKETRFEKIAEEKLTGAHTQNTQCKDYVYAEIQGRGFRPDIGICQMYDVIKPGGVLHGLEPCEHYKKKTD